MIVPCPACGQRISDRHKTCPHCQYALSRQGQGLSMQQASDRQAWRSAHRLNMHMYASILLMTIGVTWVYYDSDGFQVRPGYWSSAALVAGALWYLGSRVYKIYRRLRP